jgi:hypothetical protein
MDPCFHKSLDLSLVLCFRDVTGYYSHGAMFRKNRFRYRERTNGHGAWYLSVWCLGATERMDGGRFHSLEIPTIPIRLL